MGGHKVQSTNTIEGVNNQMDQIVYEINILRNEGENYQNHIQDEIATLRKSAEIH